MMSKHESQSNIAHIKAIMTKYNNKYGVSNKKDGVEFYFEISKKEGAERAACDYISGMSDSYSLKVYNDLFVPKTWDF